MQNMHKFDDTQEAGTQEAESQTDESMGPTFQKSDVTDLVNEAFDVFQNYMKVKMQQIEFMSEEMQLTDFMSEEMIDECIDVSKYVMKKKISEQYNKE